MATLNEALNQGIALQNAGRLREADQVYQAILRADPNQRDAIYLSGVLALLNGNPARGIELMQRAIALGLLTAELLNNLGAAYVHAQQPPQALSCFDRAIQLAPTHAASYYNKACLLKDSGDLAGAASHLRTAIHHDPRYTAALNNLASLLIDHGDLNEAATMLERCLQIDPRHVRALSNLGMYFQKTHQYAQAEAVYRRTIEIDPNYALAHHNLASLLFDRSQLDEALASYQRATQLDPRSFESFVGLGTTLATQSKVTESRAAYQQALTMRDDPGLRLRLALQMPVVASSAVEAQWSRQRIEDAVDELLLKPPMIRNATEQVGTLPFYLAFQGLDERPFLERLSTLLRRASPDLNFVAEHCRAPVSLQGKRPLRIGFVSKYLFDHPVGKHNATLFEQLPRDEFELIVARPAHQADDVSRRIAQSCHQSVTLHHDFHVARRQLADLKLDVLNYTDIGMDPWSTFLAYARLAPVQCVFTGHPVTTGLSTIDYFISSRLMEFRGAEEHYTEKLVQLETLPSLYTPPELTTPVAPREALGLPATGNLYISAQTLFKYHPADDELFAQILRADPQGWLVMFDGRHANWTQIMRARFASTMGDVAPRIVFHPRVKTHEFLQILSHAAAVLDTPRFNGGTTTIDALSVGAPVVTLPGPYLRTRTTLGCYLRMQISELYASDRDRYVKLAVRLGLDPRWREQMRQKILAARDKLLHNPGYPQELAAFFRSLA